MLSEGHDGSVSEIDEYRTGKRIECRSKYPTSQHMQTASTSYPTGIAKSFPGVEGGRNVN